MQHIRFLFLPLIFCAISVQLFSQENRFFIPKEIKKAYENGTRSLDGKPGEKYWQNQVDYDIDVSLNPTSKVLTGSETITYHNNSPDKLTQLVIRLYQDNFKKGNARAFGVNPEDINNGVEISRLVIDGESLKIEESTSRNGTNMTVNLPDAIASGAKATIEIDWSFIVPSTLIRMGAYDNNAFYIAYWFPQVAVYDDLFGWDNLSYDFSTEFYNELGDFDVRITVPDSMTVVATGVLQNAEEILSPGMFDRYQKAGQSTETITIISKEDAEKGYQHQSGTWHFTADEVNDFSFCVSDHFVWESAIQKVEDRDVRIHSFYNITVAESATELTQVQRKTMQHFSEDVPGVPYPYPEFTTCVMGRSGGGMETPMMANNGQPGRGVTIHEMMHTYFPMYVRTNEKRFAWMDEGWADFNTTYLITRYFEEKELKISDFASGGVGGMLGTFGDLPLITSTQYMDQNYGYASYSLPNFLYGILHNHLGDDLFRQCYATYINDWAKKAPSPYDFIFTFERVSGQDLSWFWNPWFFQFGNVDVKIENYNDGDLVITNSGNRPIPLLIDVTYQDSSTFFIDQSAKIWNGTKEVVIQLPNHEQIASITVNGEMPDANNLDNYHPSLRDRYGDFEINEKYLGSYSIVEFPISIVISEKKDLVYVDITNTGIQSYMKPMSVNRFQSLDGNWTCELMQEDEGINIKVVLQQFGITLTGSKE